MTRLNLGCGDRPMADAVNHDRTGHSSWVDVSWDLLSVPWPRPEQPYDEVHLRDVLEHIPPDHFYALMDEVWAQLRVGGLAIIQVPQWGSANAQIDPTHWRGFHLDSLDFLDPRTRLGRQSWVSCRPWRIVEKRVIPRTNTNLRFVLEKLPC